MPSAPQRRAAARPGHGAGLCSAVTVARCQWPRLCAAWEHAAHRAPHERTRSTLQQERAVAARSGGAARPRRPDSVSKAQGRARGARARGSGERARGQHERLLEMAVAAICAAAEKRAARLPSLCLSAFSSEARSGSVCKRGRLIKFSNKRMDIMVLVILSEQAPPPRFTVASLALMLFAE